MRITPIFKKAILKTFYYADLFDFPLTQAEAWQRLQIGRTKGKISKKYFINLLQELVKKKKLEKNNEFYFFKKRKDICRLRLKRSAVAKEKSEYALKIVRILSKLPTIKMIAITGGLAAGNAGENDDIDLFVISRGKRLWLTRMFLVFLADILGIRRRPKETEIKNKFCLNMFLDEAALAVPAEKRNLFTAHEIIQLKPIYEKDETYEKFLKANLWVKKYLPNKEIKKLRNGDIKRKKTEISSILISEYLNILFDFLEKIAYWLQLKNMKHKRTSEYISPQAAFFHPKDRSCVILKRFKNHLKKFGVA